MFGGFVFVVVFLGRTLAPRVGVWFVFVMPVFGVFLLGQIVLIRILLVPSGVSCFCLESLILAQDERWRRA